MLAPAHSIPAAERCRHGVSLCSGVFLARSFLPPHPFALLLWRGGANLLGRKGQDPRKRRNEAQGPSLLPWSAVCLLCPGRSCLVWPGCTLVATRPAIFRMHRALRITSSRFLLLFCLLATCVFLTLHWPLSLANIVSAAVHRSFDIQALPCIWCLLSLLTSHLEHFHSFLFIFLLSSSFFLLFGQRLFLSV